MISYPVILGDYPGKHYFGKVNHLLRLCITMPLLLSLLLLSGCQGGHSELGNGKERISAFTFRPIAESASQGVLDLRQWSTAQQPIIKLEGEWAVHWQQFIPPTQGSQQQNAQPIPTGYYTVPASWTAYAAEAEGSSTFSTFGYASYSLTLLLPPEPQAPFTLKVPDMGTALHLYANGQLLAAIGQPGTSKANTTPGVGIRYVDLPANAQRVHLVAHIANYHHAKAGIWWSMQLGSTPIMQNRRVYRAMASLGIFGGICLMALYHLGLWASRRKELAPLYFSGFSLLISLRLLMTQDRLLQEIFTVPFPLFYRLEYLTINASVGLFTAFAHAMYPKEMGRTIPRLLIGLSVLMVASLALPVRWFSMALPAYQLVVVLGVLLGLVVIMKAVLKQRHSALTFLLGYLVFMGSVVNDILYVNHLVNTGMVVPFGLLFFIVSQAFSLAARFSKAFTTIEGLHGQLATANKELQGYSKEMETQRDEIAAKNTAITNSITYAKRIQAAMLPTTDAMAEALGNCFVFFRPRSIVSGDFYWWHQQNGHTFWAVADCTGHGVSGAMVSMVCYNALNRAIKEFDLTDPGQVLDKTRELVEVEFGQGSEKIQDGMDIALCVRKGMQLQFAGAFRPLWLVREGLVKEFKGDSQPIGRFALERPFSTQTLELNTADRIYLATDGYPDQFGGLGGNKYMVKQLKALLLAIQHLPMEKQQNAVATAFDRWRGSYQQIDDVCLMGVEVKEA